MRHIFHTRELLCNAQYYVQLTVTCSSTKHKRRRSCRFSTATVGTRTLRYISLYTYEVLWTSTKLLCSLNIRNNTYCVFDIRLYCSVAWNAQKCLYIKYKTHIWYKQHYVKMTMEYYKKNFWQFRTEVHEKNITSNNLSTTNTRTFELESTPRHQGQIMVNKQMNHCK